MTTEPRIIKFYETTLRDGEKTPGVNYFPEEKLQIAQALADMGFDTLDCGFPISSPGEFEAVRLIASQVDNAEICAIARSFPQDIDRAWEAVKDAAHPAVQPFISTSPLHRQVKLGKSREEVLELADRARHRPAELSGGQRQRVTIARALTNDPSIVWADEPTGNLDSETALEIMELISRLNRENGQTFVVVTHALEVGNRANRIIRMRDGRIVEESVVL